MGFPYLSPSCDVKSPKISGFLTELERVHRHFGDPAADRPGIGVGCDRCDVACDGVRQSHPPSHGGSSDEVSRG